MLPRGALEPDLLLLLRSVLPIVCRPPHDCMIRSSSA